MRVLVVTTSYPRHPGDAAGSFVATRVADLRAGGAVVEVIAAGPGHDAGGVERVPGAGLFYAGGAPEALERAPFAAGVAAARFWAALVQVLRARVLTGGIDRIESHWLVPSALAVDALGYTGPHRAHAHSGDVALLERLPLGAALARRLCRAELVFASADLRARFGRLVGGHGDVGTVAAADSPLQRAPVRLSPGQARAFLAARHISAPVVLGVGRLVPIKGYDRLVRAVGRLPAAARPALVLLGEGPERARLEAMARARGVTLHLPGEVDAAEVGQWLASARVFAHPARRLRGRSEGAPVAVREAIAAGLPVLASATGGVPELVMGSARFTLLQDGEGSLGVAAWAAALARVLPAAPEGPR